MGKTKSPDPPNFQKYGVPFYGAAWLPPKIKPHHKQQGDDEVSSDESLPSIANENYLVFAGGVREGRSGIPNAVLLAHFDFASNSLSDQPVAKLGTDADLPYRMAVHPGGEGFICSFPGSCRWYDWEEVKSAEVHNMGLKLSKKVLTQLEDVGQQLALRFNNGGSVLAVGGEEGNLRVFKWPRMEIILDEAQAHSVVEDLDFSPDGKYLVSLGWNDPRRVWDDPYRVWDIKSFAAVACRVWDIKSSAAVASLLKENDEVFGFCRFSQMSDKSQVLYTTVMRAQGGSIVTWNSTSWKRMGSKQIVRDAISAFNVSADGKLLAIGTDKGDILIVNSTSMQTQMMVKKAHLGVVTALMFSQDSRALVSASVDESARVTLIKEKTAYGFSLWVIVFIIVPAIAAYALKTLGILP